MKSIKVYHYDAFSKKPNKGNPAGVVLNGDDLTETEMQDLAFKVGFNETAFPIASDRADLRIRYFSPKQEMELCGHATMATIYALKTNGWLENKTELTIETNAGVLPIRITKNEQKEIHITMKQALPQFKKFEGSRYDLAKAIGIEEVDFDDELPIMYGSTGAWTLLIPIKSLDIFNKMEPNNKVFSSILNEIPNASVHPFCLESYYEEADMHGRHFSSTFSGTIEDPVTGTASGVMGAYFAKYIKKESDMPINLIVEQGQEMNKDGQVIVNVAENNEIEITGNAVYVDEIDISF
ncbi:PhzF family phenazine biosynthesis isomerase [Staphylococcus equorum]|uniref:PhzF family phenazine biosynthesis isomerase n=1 Tax=Staphylococcus equorum TaxID=246432 RepID=UPI000E6798F0|nr:PhzF family phenazine biosynthesis isomerase [Staphylococcus equorum]MCE5047982.1 PhzF family phenazine biosynthesis isomerase [Staphylococcus equorum]MEB7670870.1 PhzF family phenazine biosynthesis isomerase [Staphylococcus equorum]MEB7690813.1 PhzF family phenazine biosynthesis isomerase [Staphylococcus equorum]MEB7715869.1 PhzF family phenazine biosynthesis isomerase [Staphylococcus equorum]MEB7747334.1 PhzF family phenazine biosynthesis isomerase [Staphylococcus equorum]